VFFSDVLRVVCFVQAPSLLASALLPQNLGLPRGLHLIGQLHECICPCLMTLAVLTALKPQPPAPAPGPAVAAPRAAVPAAAVNPPPETPRRAPPPAATPAAPAVAADPRTPSGPASSHGRVLVDAWGQVWLQDEPTGRLEATRQTVEQLAAARPDLAVFPAHPHQDRHL
jgi:hypothetical protein